MRNLIALTALAALVAAPVPAAALSSVGMGVRDGLDNEGYNDRPDGNGGGYDASDYLQSGPATKDSILPGMSHGSKDESEGSVKGAIGGDPTDRDPTDSD